MTQPRDRDRMFQRAVGLLLMASLVAVLWFVRVHRQGMTPFEHAARLQTLLPRADGMTVNAPVTLAGLKVGRVDGLELTPDNRIRLSLEVDAQVVARLREDAVATVMRPILGTATVEIDPGSSDRPARQADTWLSGRVQPDLNDVLATLPARLAKVDATLDNLAAMSGDLRQLSRAATTGGTSIETTLAHLQASSRQAERATGQLAGTLGEARDAIRQIGPMLVATRQIVDDLGAASGRVAPMAIMVDAVLDDVLAVTRELRAAAPQLPGLVGSGRHAAEEADDILGAARRSVLLRSSLPAPAPLPQWPSPR